MAPIELEGIANVGIVSMARHWLGVNRRVASVVDVSALYPHACVCQREESQFTSEGFNGRKRPRTAGSPTWWLGTGTALVGPAASAMSWAGATRKK